jgi:hypothetical protein
MPNKTIYADNIANFSIIDGVARFDLVCLEPTSSDPKATQKVGSIKMPLSGLLRTHGQLEELVNKMVNQGVIKKVDSNIIE